MPAGPRPGITDPLAERDLRRSMAAQRKLIQLQQAALDREPADPPIA
jgi:hypothetical protein